MPRRRQARGRAGHRLLEHLARLEDRPRRGPGPLSSQTITLHEHTGDAGELVRTLLTSEEGELTLVVGEEVLPLPEGAIAAVMRRFGKPLEVDAPPAEETLELGEGSRLERFRFLRRYDVIARDYLVYHAVGAEPLCEMAAAVTAALDHLGRRLAARDEG